MYKEEVQKARPDLDPAVGQVVSRAHCQSPSERAAGSKPCGGKRRHSHNLAPNESRIPPVFFKDTFRKSRTSERAYEEMERPGVERDPAPSERRKSRGR